MVGWVKKADLASPTGVPIKAYLNCSLYSKKKLLECKYVPLTGTHVFYANRFGRSKRCLAAKISFSQNVCMLTYIVRHLPVPMDNITIGIIFKKCTIM